jgi:hypothetical protein
MRIVALRKFRKGHRQGYFNGLPRELQYVAYQWLNKFISRWHRDLPPWRLAILVGQAKRLALNPPNSKWGRSMLAKRGGQAVQRKYLIEGREPTERATAVRLAKQKKEKADRRFREQYAAYLEPSEAQKPRRMRIKHLDLF